MWITFEHLHTCPSFAGRAGFCHAGARRLAASLGLSWPRIVREGGIDSAALTATGNPLARRLVEWAQSREEDGHGAQ